MRPALVLLAVAIVSGLALRIVVIADKPAVGHDEAISYLAATCHQGEWDRITARGAAPSGAWVPAREWRRLVEPDDSLCLGRISRDLSRHDIHPPLYFWLLHAWVGAFGVDTATGPALNLLFFVAAALALFGLARRLLGDERGAALVTFVWAVSPAVVPISGEARMYDLLALVSILFAWQAVRIAEMERASPRALALLGLAAACGIATAFTFALVAGGGLAWLALRLGWRRRGQIAAAALAVAAGFALFYAVDPHFPTSFEIQREQVREEFSLDGLPERLDRTAEGFAGFVLPPQLLRRGVAWALLALACLALLAAAAALARRRAAPPAGAALFLAAAVGGGTVLLYLGFRTHGLAMGGKYLAACWPFLAFVPVLGLMRARAHGVAAAAVLCAALLAAGVAGALRANGDDRPPAGFDEADRVLVDTVRRGVLVPVVLQLPPDTPVFAAPQARLTRSPDPWLAGLRGGGLYVSDTYYGNEGAQRAILARLRGRQRADRVVPDPRGAASAVFVVRPAR